MKTHNEGVTIEEQTSINGADVKGRVLRHMESYQQGQMLLLITRPLLEEGEEDDQVTLNAITSGKQADLIESCLKMALALGGAGRLVMLANHLMDKTHGYYPPKQGKAMTNIQLCVLLLMGILALILDLLCRSIGYSLLFLLGATTLSISLSIYWREEHDKLQQQIKDYTRKYGHK